MRGISWLDEAVLASQEGLCPADLISSLAYGMDDRIIIVWFLAGVRELHQSAETGCGARVTFWTWEPGVFPWE
jgi:hypothetical protein